VATSSQSCRIYGLLSGVLLLALGPFAFAANGLVASSRVSLAEAEDSAVATLEIRFNCKVQYLRHEPQGSSDSLRIYLDPTSVCNGVSPLVAESRGRYRPINADDARLVDLEYDGTSAGGPMLTINFSEQVQYDVAASAIAFSLDVAVTPLSTQAIVQQPAPDTVTRRVTRPELETPDYAINLISYRRIPTAADAPNVPLGAGQRIYYSEAEVDGAIWYRLRLGNFNSSQEAASVLAALKADHPGAWIGQVDPGAVENVLLGAAANLPPVQSSDTAGNELIAETTVSLTSDLESGGSKVDTLMEDARKSMVAGETSRAIQIYTKILQMPQNSRQPEAQEYLALAREKNGQMAHAKAEYERYLSLYPDSEGAARVGQRLAALLASGQQANNGTVAASGNTADFRRTKTSDWRFQTSLSQYYRRDVNQPNDQDEIVSQSALYTDINFDARRRGERFDFTSRVSAGYRMELLPEDEGSGDSLRVSYGYADLTDTGTGLRGRIGRQSRHSGGVLGRFDGLTLGYQLNDRILINTVVGKPVYSASNSDAPSREFFGASVNYGPVLDNLDLGVFYIEQTIEGIQDRQAVGGEFRYFGANQSLWGMFDYDLSYGKLASAFVQGSWRFPSRLSIHAVADQRSSPFLGTGNAMIGQNGVSFAQLIEIFGEDALRQFALDRTSASTTYTLGISYPLTPRLHINVDASDSTLEETTESGGVFANPGSSYNYFSGSLVASSLLKEGDVTIVTARYTETDTTEVMSMTLDSRIPFGRQWRINPRLRVDRRLNLRSSTYEWLYTPGLRIHYRRSQKLRIELELGKQFSEHADNADLDRESYFINLGYQAFF
jgi:tetratricopeptide (TPR) repeat protein